jgi:hypothetical protein
MQHGVVEGEPGVFPAPIAKVMRSIGGLFGRKKHDTAAPPPPPGETEPPSWSELDPKPSPSRTAEATDQPDPPSPPDDTPSWSELDPKPSAPLDGDGSESPPAST